MSVRLYLLQRLTAMIMAPLVLGHVATIFYAMQGGLTAAEILGRTRGSGFWALFYGLFVTAAAVHGAIGLRGVLAEWGPHWLSRRARVLDAAMWGLGLVLVAAGLRAVFAVVH